MTMTDVAHDPRYDDSEFEYAGFWERLAAYFVDSIILMLISLPFTYYSYRSMADLPVDELPIYTMWDSISTVLCLALTVWFLVKKGATPGKMLFGMQVRDATTGRFISVPKALLRQFGYIVSAMVLFLGFIWIGFDKKKQGWHDKIAGTVVVKRIR